MKRFFDITFRPFFVLTGAATALAAILAFWPRWASETILRIPFVQNDTVIVLVANSNHSYADGLRLGAMMDASVVLYPVAYFWVQNRDIQP